MRYPAMVTMAAIFASALASAAEYQISNVSDDALSDWDVDLNDHGHVVWEKVLLGPDGRPSGIYSEIFLFDGVDIHRVTDNAFSETNPHVNNSGQIVWMGEPVPRLSNLSYEVFFLDGAQIHQLSTNIIHDTNPQINDLGQLTWQTIETYNPYTYINFFDGLNVIQLANVPYYQQTPQINNSGHVAWFGRTASGEDEIFYYDGVQVAQITNNNLDDYGVRLSDSGLIAWVGYDGNDYEIFTHQAGFTLQVTDNDYDDYAVKLNDHGQLAWMGYLAGGSSSGSEIFFFDGIDTHQLTDNDVYDRVVGINNNGHIAFTRRLTTDFNSTEVFVYDGNEIIRVTDNDRIEGSVRINDQNQLAWYGYGPHFNQYGHRATDVFLASRIEPIDVLVDIKPGSNPNCFNNNGAGVIPVAILGSPEFDASRIDASSVLLSGLTVRVVGKSDKLLAALEDVNADGFFDLVVQIQDEDGVFEIGDMSASVTGRLLPEFDALPIRGWDQICITQ